MQISPHLSPTRLMTRTAVALAAASIAVIALTGCAPAATTTAPTATATSGAAIITDAPCVDDTGVTLIVDATSIDDAEPATWCVPTDAPIIGSDLLASAGVETVGTTEYPDMIVCRVDGVPAADTELVSTDGTVVTESCESMPPAFAYWSLWVKPADSDWEYAMEGLSTLELAPGDSLELLFQLNGEPLTP